MELDLLVTHHVETGFGIGLLMNWQWSRALNLNHEVENIYFYFVIEILN
jgi:hypothetical protein